MSAANGAINQAAVSQVLVSQVAVSQAAVNQAAVNGVVNQEAAKINLKSYDDRERREIGRWRER